MKIALLLLFPVLAYGQCGVGGTAKVADGTVVTRTAAEAKNTRIGDDGYWWTCSRKVEAPKVSCAVSQPMRMQWMDGSALCTANGTIVGPVPHGEIRSAVATKGAIGMARFRCENGQFVAVTSYCTKR